MSFTFLFCVERKLLSMEDENASYKHFEFNWIIENEIDEVVGEMFTLNYRLHNKETCMKMENFFDVFLVMCNFNRKIM